MLICILTKNVITSCSVTMMLFLHLEVKPLMTLTTVLYLSCALISGHLAMMFAFLGTINPDTNKIPKHLFQGYLNIYNNYFKAPWMPDRTEANPNELNQDDARYGFRCCHLKNIWTAPLPPET